MHVKIYSAVGYNQSVQLLIDAGRTFCSCVMCLNKTDQVRSFEVKANESEKKKDVNKYNSVRRLN